MPLVTVKMFPGRNNEQKKALVDEVTAALVQTCNARREDVWVIIEEVPREHWSLAGTLYSEKKEP